MQRLQPALFLAILVTAIGFGDLVQASSIRFIPVNEEIAARKIAFRDDKGNTTLKELNANQRSAAYPYKIGKKPLMLVALDREGANGEPEAIEIALAAGMKSPLVVILADPAHPSGLGAIAVEGDSAGFPWGSLRFINKASALMIRFEKEVVKLPASPAPVDIVPGGEPRNVGVQLFKEEEPSSVLYSAVWEHDPNVRKLILVMPSANERTKTLELKIIPQDKRIKD